MRRMEIRKVFTIIRNYRIFSMQNSFSKFRIIENIVHLQAIHSDSLHASDK